jgi:hypothetical protein
MVAGTHATKLSLVPAVLLPYQNPMQLYLRGLLRARSRFPEIVENVRNTKQRMEGLERGLVLAKQEYCTECIEVLER